MSPAARITLATLIAVGLGLAFIATRILPVPMYGVAMLCPGILVACALANDWTFKLHAVGAFVASFTAAAAVGFAMSAPALFIGIAWVMTFVLSLGVAGPFRLVRGARTRLNPELTSRAQRRRAAVR
jgi:hypothetical protein